MSGTFCILLSLNICSTESFSLVNIRLSHAIAPTGSRTSLDNWYILVSSEAFLVKLFCIEINEFNVVTFAIVAHFKKKAKEIETRSVLRNLSSRE